jgi:hypothetical protein
MTRIIDAATNGREDYLAALHAHFSRAESTIGSKLEGTTLLYLWPKADPERWFVALTTASAANPNGLTAYMGWGKDPGSTSGTDTLSTWLPSNATPALTQHVTGIAHTKFMIHEYGDAVFIAELHSSNTYFTKMYHFGECYTPLYANAAAAGMRGLAILGGSGVISTLSQMHAFIEVQTILSNQLASRVQIFGANWVANSGPKASSTGALSLPSGYPGLLGSALSPYMFGAGGTVTSTIDIGMSKYMGQYSQLRPPTTRLVDDVNEVAWVATHNASSSTSWFVRAQYGIVGLLS